jgi:hypothetical protein
MSFWCHRLDKKNNEIFSMISALWITLKKANNGVIHGVSLHKNG